MVKGKLSSLCEEIGIFWKQMVLQGWEDGHPSVTKKETATDESHSISSLENPLSEAI